MRDQMPNPPARKPARAPRTRPRSTLPDEDAAAPGAVPPEERSIARQIDALTDPSFMTSFARGLAVVRAFGDARRTMTIAQISTQTGIPRAAVRRCLHTLKQLGYADAEMNNFSLRPKILGLGYAYLSSTPLSLSAQPCLDDITRRLHESCSLAVLDDDQVLYIARSATSRVMSVALNPGSRLPAYCTSLGRVLLAGLPEIDCERYLARTRLQAMTPHTITTQKRLREILAGVREAGHAVVEEELEIGLRSIAVPVRGASGSVVAALNVGAQAGRVPRRQMEEQFLPLLREGADELAVLLP